MTVTIEQAQASLPELIAKLAPGEEVEITHGDQRVAKLIVEQPVPRKARRAGSAKGKLVILKEDNEYLADFGEYMP